ncbi:hypothetical protein [Candidatus Oscillochloris fontis]|uniref:hypothetical protein n=1 Tax=Candidatus Oscillochloris fontis TaxID=2496868 RepID=UPI00101CB671|nr:hypothetical protein [Candidatus Oscillochloris fontis]
MSITSILRPRTIFAFVLALIMGSVAYGFAAENTIPESRAGDKDTVVSGYVVTNVAYILNTDPTKLDTVTFTLDAAAGTVKVQLIDGGSWYDAAVVTGNNWEVDLSAAPLNVIDIDTLQIVATSNVQP